MDNPTGSTAMDNLEGKKQKNFQKPKHSTGNHLEQSMPKHSRNPGPPKMESRGPPHSSTGTKYLGKLEYSNSAGLK